MSTASTAPPLPAVIRAVGAADNTAVWIGRYRDTDTPAYWRLTRNGAHHGAITADTGLGSTTLLELIAASAVAAGSTVLINLDITRSSPTLAGHAALAAATPATCEKALAPLERIIQQRQLFLCANNLAAFPISSERPGILVAIHNAHHVLDQDPRRWTQLARHGRKTGISLIAQAPALGAGTPATAELQRRHLATANHAGFHQRGGTEWAVPRIPGVAALRFGAEAHRQIQIGYPTVQQITAGLARGCALDSETADLL